MEPRRARHLKRKRSDGSRNDDSLQKIFDFLRQNSICGICRETLYLPMRIFECEHHFCISCIYGMLSNRVGDRRFPTCPFCRRNLCHDASTVMPNMLSHRIHVTLALTTRMISEARVQEYQMIYEIIVELMRILSMNSINMYNEMGNLLTTSWQKTTRDTRRIRVFRQNLSSPRKNYSLVELVVAIMAMLSDIGDVMESESKWSKEFTQKVSRVGGVLHITLSRDDGSHFDITMADGTSHTVVSVMLGQLVITVVLSDEVIEIPDSYRHSESMWHILSTFFYIKRIVMFDM